MVAFVYWTEPPASPSMPAHGRPRRRGGLIARTARRLVRRPETWGELVLLVVRWGPVAGSLAWAALAGVMGGGR